MWVPWGSVPKIFQLNCQLQKISPNLDGFNGFLFILHQSRGDTVVSRFPKVAPLKNVGCINDGEFVCSRSPVAYTCSWQCVSSNLRGWHSEPAHFTFSKNDPRPCVSRLPVE